MSLQMRVVAAVMRATRKRQMSTVERARARIDAPKGSATPPASVSDRHSVSRRTVRGFDVYSIVPADGRWNHAALYLHGGAYIGEIAPQHYTFIGRLVDSGVRVDVPIYGLAPQHTAAEAYELVLDVYRDMLDDAGVEQVTVMGDSAGGGLALGVLQQLAALGLPAPRNAILISPWLDAALSNPAIDLVEKRDPWLAGVGLREAARAWAGDLSLDDPRVSPINGTLAGLPPIEIWCGTRDLLHPDVVVLARAIADAGGQVRLTECAGAIHVYPVLPTPEGRAATREIVDAVTKAGRPGGPR